MQPHREMSRQRHAHVQRFRRSLGIHRRWIDRGHCAGNGRSQLRVNTRDGAGGRIAK